MQFIAKYADGQEDAHKVTVVIDLAAEDVHLDGMGDVQHAVAVAVAVAVATGFKKFINNEDR